MKKLYFVFVLCLLLTSLKIKACVWMESADTYRIAMFSVLTPRMIPYSPFYYSADKFNDLLVDPQHNDRTRNCKEWMQQLGPQIKENEVYVLLYNTTPDLFIGSVKNKTLKSDFEKNIFVETLLKPENKSYLDYLTFSKRIEYWDFIDSDLWGSEQKTKTVDPATLATELIKECETKVKVETNLFLKQRYAYQLIRLYQRNNLDDKCIQAADLYISLFPQSILGVWVKLHRGIAESRKGNKIQANYLFSLSFANCDEKKFRSMQLFVNDDKTIAETYKLAKNNIERANIVSMALLQYPGRSIDKIRQVFRLDPKNEMIPLLVMREVNKLEDWIGTPSYTFNAPSLTNIYENYTKLDSIKAVNLASDKLYLKSTIAMLDSMKSQINAETKAYFSIALAHLSFLNDQPIIASRYLSEIKDNAPESILAQKYVDEILQAASKMKLNDPNLHNYIAERLLKLEAKETKNKQFYKTLYSLTRYFATQYSQNHDEATAALFVLKSNLYKAKYNLEAETNPFLMGYYEQMAYFDKNATLADLDKLVAMIKKPSTKLETYLSKDLTPEKYIELSGTFAFRENKFDLALQYFKQLPNNYWQKEYDFKSCLNEDPFQPKALVAKKNRKFNYRFNKAEFVTKLIQLKKESESSSPQKDKATLQLAHALYNCSYFGNSWMMNFYGWSVSPENGTPYDQDYGVLKINQQLKRNYFQCELASEYYKKALQYATNEEVKAEAALMLHRCDLNKFTYLHCNDADENFLDKYSPVFLKEFSLHTKTKFYAEITSNCQDVKAFLKKYK